LTHNQDIGTPLREIGLEQRRDRFRSQRRRQSIPRELGGNAPFIVFDDADLDRAVEGAIAAKFSNSGQTCVCTNRFYAQAGIYDAFVEKLTAAVKKLKIGSGLEAGVTQGPLIDDKAIAKVEEMVADAKAKGGSIATGGKRSELGLSFYEPTVIAGATSGMQFAREEIFGPVAPVFRFTLLVSIDMGETARFTVHIRPHLAGIVAGHRLLRPRSPPRRDRP
jgi:succinate-semialdehyde dehydrogenase/glutarate-semialdehyde dehydrogenase